MHQVGRRRRKRRKWLEEEPNRGQPVAYMFQWLLNMSVWAMKRRGVQIAASVALLAFAVTTVTAQAGFNGVSTILVKCKDPKNESTCYVVQIPVVEQNNGYIAEAVFLALLFLAAFVLNMILLVAIATSMDLKRHHHNHIIMHMAVPNLVECVCNVSIAVGYVASEPWAMGRIVCDVNAFTMYLVSVVQSAFVLWLACDRFLALKTFLWYKRVMTLARVNVICVTIWLVSIGSVVVLAPGVIINSPFPTRYSCSPLDSERQMGFEIFILILVVIICNAGALLFFVGLALLIRAELADDNRPWVQSRRRNNQSASSRGLFRTPKLSREADATKVSIAVAVAFLFLWIPYIINMRVEQMAVNFYANYTDSRQVAPGAVAAATSSAATANTTTLSNSTNPNVLPEVLNGTTLSTVFTWFRFIFALIYPLLVLVFNPQTKLKFDSIICCWSSTSIYGESRVMSALPMKQKTSFRNPASDGNGNKALMDTSGTNPKAATKRSKDSVSFKTPILFATVEGLHLRSLDAASLQKIPKQKSSWLDLNLSANSRTVWGQQYPRFIAEMCDQYVIDDTLPPHKANDNASSPHQAGHGDEDDVPAVVGVGSLPYQPSHLDDDGLDGLSVHTVDSAEIRRSQPSSYVPGIPGPVLPPSPSPDDIDAATDVTALDSADEEESSVPSTATSSSTFDSGVSITPPKNAIPGVIPRVPGIAGRGIIMKPNNGGQRPKKTVRFSDSVIEIPTSVFDFSGSYYEEGSGVDNYEDPSYADDSVALTPTSVTAHKPVIKKMSQSSNASKNPGRKIAGKISSFTKGTRQSIQNGSSKVPAQMSLGAARRNSQVTAKVDSKPRKIPVRPKNEGKN